MLKSLDLVYEKGVGRICFAKNTFEIDKLNGAPTFMLL
jgi:hypothetical protein